MRLVAIKLLNSFSESAVISRIYGCNFSVVLKGVTKAEVIAMSEKCIKIINSIKEIDGRQCRIKAAYGASFASERDTVQEIAELARLRMKGEWVPLSDA